MRGHSLEKYWPYFKIPKATKTSMIFLLVFFLPSSYPSYFLHPGSLPLGQSLLFLLLRTESSSQGDISKGPVTLHTKHCTLYTVYCTLYTVQGTLATAHCTLQSVQSKLYIAHQTLFNLILHR